jgi:hypothetical protein
MSNEKITEFLLKRLNKYNCVVIAEDKNLYLSGMVILVQSLTQGMMPLYLAKTTAELSAIHLQMLHQNIKTFYIMDNHFKCTVNEPLGKDLIVKFGIEYDCILCTDDDPDNFKNVVYPVFGKAAFDLSL